VILPEGSYVYDAKKVLKLKDSQISMLNHPVVYFK